MTKYIDHDTESGEHEAAVYEDVKDEPLTDKGLISFREWGGAMADLKASRWGTSIQFDGKYFIDPHCGQKVGRLYSRRFLSPWYASRTHEGPFMFYMLHWCGKEYKGEDEQFVEDLDWDCRRDFRNHYDWSDEIIGAIRNGVGANERSCGGYGAARVRLEPCDASNLDNPVTELCTGHIIDKFKETMERARRAIKHTSSTLQELHDDVQHIHNVCMISYTACPELKPPANLLHKVVVKRMEGGGGHEENYYEKKAQEVLKLLSVICDEEKIKSQDGVL